MSDGNESNLHVAVLAAGAGTRFGSPKQLVRIAGRPVLHQVLSNAAAVSGQSVSVVLGAHARELAASIRQASASIVFNRDWLEGIASSVRAAVASAPPGCEGLMLLQTAQVAVTADDLLRLRAAWLRQASCVVASLYDGAPGLPAIFPRWCFGELQSLRGERDPRSIIRRNIDRLVRVPMPSAALTLNTPEDLLFVGARADSEPAA